MATTCTHPKRLVNTGTCAATRQPAARAWCPACGADTDWLDGTAAAAREALNALKPPAPKANK